MLREGMFHNGVHFAFAGALHYINFRKLVGKGVTVYGQQEVVKDLIERRLADGGQILFEVADVSVHDFTGKSPKIRFSACRQGAGARLRFHRRLRRLPRHLPAEHSGERAHCLRP